MISITTGGNHRCYVAQGGQQNNILAVLLEAKFGPNTLLELWIVLWHGCLCDNCILEVVLENLQLT